MRWTAVVPLKLGDASKSRLGELLPVSGRLELVEAMARHVLDVLAQEPRIERIVVLSPCRPAWWNGAFAKDDRGSLNEALTAWRAAEDGGAFAVIHGDLPYLQVSDIARLLDAGQAHGAALAADAEGLGTNALAIADNRPFRFCFGPGSRNAHICEGASLVGDVPGIARDIDTPGEFAELVDSGFLDDRKRRARG